MLRSLEALVGLVLSCCRAVVVGGGGSGGDDDDSSAARWIAISVPTCAL